MKMLKSRFKEQTAEVRAMPAPDPRPSLFPALLHLDHTRTHTKLRRGH
jgi:hypothetical protein